jgi:hypothetical protein
LTVQILDQLSILLADPLRHMKNTFFLVSGKLHDIATDKFHDAFELLDDCVCTLRKFKCGTGTIPSCPLLMANEAKAAKAKVEKTSKHNAGIDAPGTGLITPDAKLQHTGKPGNALPSADNLSGTLI